MKLNETVALVTGGASGLGEATVRTFAGSGAKVAILDRPQSNGAQLAEELGANAIFVSADVTSEEQVAAAVQSTVDRFGALHIAVSCAGVGAAMKTVSKQGPMPLNIFSMVIQINLIGTFNVIRLAAAAMVKNNPN